MEHMFSSADASKDRATLLIIGGVQVTRNAHNLPSARSSTTDTLFHASHNNAGTSNGSMGILVRLG